MIKTTTPDLPSEQTGILSFNDFYIELTLLAEYAKDRNYPLAVVVLTLTTSEDVDVIDPYSHFNQNAASKFTNHLYERLDSRKVLGFSNKEHELLLAFVVNYDNKLADLFNDIENVIKKMNTEMPKDREITACVGYAVSDSQTILFADQLITDARKTLNVLLK